MPASPHTRNYLYGKGELLFRTIDSEGYEHLGNVPAFSINLSEEKLEHYSSMSGTKKKDLHLVTQKGATVAFTLEEFSVGNILRAFKGNGISALAQESGTISTQSFSGKKGLYLPLGHEELRVTRISIGKVSGGSFATGGTVTGTTSSATAKVAYAETNILECVAVSGTFKIGEKLTVSGQSSLQATITGVSRVADVVVTDSASSPTIRYQAGKDYDCNAGSGLLRLREESLSTPQAVYISADYEATGTSIIEALTAGEIRGELLFVGQPDQGPAITIQCWNVTLSISGEVGFISDALAAIPMTGEILADDLNHPDSPFFQIRHRG